ncbi:rod shape-determining protein MreD [Salinicoccus halitifaciens]|uniref:Rod shape-determining protein MreD n=1 Tax=Salinicoccus halitifaciens TaxID=1073415 RepID=A0ABV2E6Y0_9STAP|nr:rod shape-determining protein MreD [Salinicoccus halitifaciens]MCD2136777.1 rod shape-determining protein MreD [Salinicoccus halitifaciens]
MRVVVIFMMALVLMYGDFLFAEFSPFNLGQLTVYTVPKLLLMFILLMSVYINPSISSFFAIVFGVLIDIYSGLVYGVHTFGMVAFVLFMHTAFRVFYKDFVAMGFVVLVLTFLYDAYVYMIYRILGLVTLPVFDYIALRGLPSLILNALLFIIVFIITLKTSKVRKNLLPKH